MQKNDRRQEVGFERRDRTRGGPARGFWIAVGVALVALAADLATKAWALTNLTEGAKRPFIGDFVTLQLIHNPGAAFSLGAGTTWIFTLLSVVAIVAIFWFAWSAKSVLLSVLLGFIAGGAAGNLWDRLTRPPGFGRGHVVDFLNYNDWFIGNVADIWIVVAAILLVVWMLTNSGSKVLAAKTGVAAPSDSGEARPGGQPEPGEEPDPDDASKVDERQ